MAIEAYVGKPGSGKSYTAVEYVVIPSLQQGRHIVTNIPLEAEVLIPEFGGSIAQLPADWHEAQDLGIFFPPGCVAIIDECWRRWPSGVNANHANPIDKALLAEHRHRVSDDGHSMRVILVTQDMAQISSWVRLLVDKTYRTRKLNKRAFKVDIYEGCVTGESPPQKKRIRTTAGTYKKTVFQYYRSATKSATGQTGDESSADGRSNPFKSFGLWAALGGGTLCLIFGIYGMSSFLSPKSEEVKHAPVAAPSPSQPAKPVQPPISTTWRIAGFVHPSKPDPNYRGVSESLVIISDANGNTRNISFRHCRYNEDFTEAYCDVDGSRVTTWAMRKPNVISGLMGAGG